MGQQRHPVPRLLAEINAIGLTDDQLQALAFSMDIDPKEIGALLERAEQRWEEIKALSAKR